MVCYPGLHDCSIKFGDIEVLWRNFIETLGVVRRDVTPGHIDICKARQASPFPPVCQAQLDNVLLNHTAKTVY